MRVYPSQIQVSQRCPRLPHRSHAVTCRAQQTDTSRLASKSERSRARRRRQGPQPPPQPAELQQERRDDVQNMPSMWQEAVEEEEAELDSMRAAEAPGNASPQPPQPSAGAAAPILESAPPSAASARSTAASERESELSGGFGTPVPEDAMSPQDQRRWESFMREVNPYDFPVRTMDEMGEAEAVDDEQSEDEDSDDDELPRPMVQMAEFTDRLPGAPAAAASASPGLRSRKSPRPQGPQGAAAEAATQQQRAAAAHLQPPSGVAADFPAADDLPGPSAANEADAQADQETKRRGAVLMRLIGAGDQLETLLGFHAEDIDEQLLEMLYSRIQLAVRDGESEENVDALTTLWRRLRAEAERAAASPAERLLDDALLLLSAPMNSEQRRRQDVESRLAAAFRPLSTRAVDVFAMAEALSQQNSSSAGGGSSLLDDIVEFVPKGEFLAQVQTMLNEAKEANRRIETRLGSLSVEERLIVGEALKERHATAEQVQLVLEIAMGVLDV